MVFSLSAKTREGGNAELVRAAGEIPGVVYGGDRAAATVVSVNGSEFARLYGQAGESTLIDFSVDGATPVKVLVQDVQLDPVKNVPVHVDFRQINMNKPMEVDVELNFVGEAPAVKELAGTLNKTIDTVTVSCLPKDLVSEITVDLGLLKTFDDVIRVKDLVAPAGITIESDLEQTVANVAPPLSEEELKAMEEASAPVDLSAIEVEKKGKTDEEAAAGENAGE
jgi:large subunit ribosomal protein L25